MKNTFKIGLIISLFVITSCTSTKGVLSSNRDGSSFNNAIVANSIAEEYEYVRKVCKDCQMVKQSLTFEKEVPYDILEFKNSNGDKVLYYFDISKFFGKGF